MAEFDARKLFEAVPDALVAADASQRILFANRHVEGLLGWASNELEGRQLAELFPPPHEPMDLGRTLRVRAARPDGSVREVELILGEAADAGDARFVATLREPRSPDPDESVRRLKSILETITIGVLVAEGPEGRLTMVNQAADRIAGEPVTADSYPEFVAKFPLERVDGRVIDGAERPLARTFKTGEPVRETLRYHRRDGQDVVLEVSTSPLPGPGGGAVTTFADVTDRHNLELELNDRAAQLRSLLDHLPVGVAYFDKMAVCRAGNAPARRFLGRTRSEILGSTADELFAISPGLSEALHRCVRDHVSHVETLVPWPDSSRPGTVRYLDWQFEPLSADPAKTRGALALIADVTERAHAEAEKQRAMEATEEASRRKTQFLSAVSHDLRTPINALSLQAELLGRIVEMRDDPGGELHLLAGDIRAASTNLIELINDLLDLTKFDSGVIDYRPSDFALDPWLASTLAPLELTARTKGLEFSWTVDRSGRTVRGDRVKLGRVLVNLVGNAVKFTERGEVSVRAGDDPDGWFRLEVRDTGSGIPPDQLERIFDEFAQLRNPERDRTKGTGLGLAICRRLVEGVGGRLLVSSELGRGSSFTAVYPPARAAGQAEPIPEPGPGSARPWSPPANPEASILVVEDDAASREVLTKLLEREGYSVRGAADGAEAIAALAEERPALVLLDLMLPGIDGGELLRRIRRDPALKGMKVVLLSGEVMTTQTDELQAMDADGILEKPVDFDALLEYVAELIPGRRPVAGE